MWQCVLNLIAAWNIDRNPCCFLHVYGYLFNLCCLFCNFESCICIQVACYYMEGHQWLPACHGRARLSNGFYSSFEVIFFPIYPGYWNRSNSFQQEGAKTFRCLWLAKSCHVGLELSIFRKMVWRARFHISTAVLFDWLDWLFAVGRLFLETFFSSFHKN